MQLNNAEEIALLLVLEYLNDDIREYLHLLECGEGEAASNHIGRAVLVLANRMAGDLYTEEAK